MDDEGPYDPEQARRLVATEYDLGTPTGIRLLNSAGNDTFAVEVSGVRYALRIYGRHRWYISGPGDYRFEHGLLQHLHAEGVPVSVPIPRRDGDPLGRVAGLDGNPYFSLFSWAPGVPGYTETLTERQAYLIGQTLAAIHVSADRYQPGPDHGRYALDERTLLDRFVAELEPSLRRDEPGDVAFINESIADVRHRLRTFDPGPGGWGVVHGDVQGHNHHFTEAGQITWFDFDLCGYGWRARTTSPTTTRASPNPYERR